MDVGSHAGFPAGTLSNFTPHAFVLDGVECSSMEGLLQSFKFDDSRVQLEICKLVGSAAKKRGQERNEVWKREQRLWWNGREYNRDSQAYQELLDRAFEALATNNSFREALVATGDAVLIHSIGNPNPNDTVLTEEEFCSRLIRIRSAVKL